VQRTAPVGVKSPTSSADLAWYGLVITVVHKGKGVLTPRSYSVTMGVLGVVLLYMGMRFVGQAFGVGLPWLPS
jgi:hypothetical protein